MCGRYSQTLDTKKLAKELGISPSKIPPLKPRYNIAPSQRVACLLHEPQREPEIQVLRWGLIPSWAKDPSIGNQMINARMESLPSKPSFRGPLRNHRCLILADGFYQWKVEGKFKRPYYVHLKSAELCTFAGLWSEWINPTGGNAIRSCTIITGPPNELVATLHNRMPVIVGTESRAAWLIPGNQELDKILAVLKPYPAEKMEIYPVSTVVNSPNNDIPDCIMRNATVALESQQR